MRRKIFLSANTRAALRDYKQRTGKQWHDVAYDINIGKNLLYRLLQGSRGVSLETAQRLAHFFHVPITDVFSLAE